MNAQTVLVAAHGNPGGLGSSSQKDLRILHVIGSQAEFLRRQTQWSSEGIVFDAAVIPFALPVVEGGPLVATHDLVRACRKQGIRRIVGYDTKTLYNSQTLRVAGCDHVTLSGLDVALKHLVQ
jgi:hypothetical protein